MADVFINYAREDRDIARRLSDSLESKGLSVFWDMLIPPGKTFAEFIENALAVSLCVITIWSKHSVKSRWVQAEARFALQHDKLLPLAIGSESNVPAQFLVIETLFFEPSELSGDEWLTRLNASVQEYLAEGRQKRTNSSDYAEEFNNKRAESHAQVSRDLPVERKKAFISYAEENEDIAIDLVKHLEASGCPCWISFRDVDPGEDYRASITQAMDEIAFLVLIYSEHVNTSFDIATELLLARKRRKRRFVLRTDSTEPAGPVEYELATVQWIDCRSGFQAAFEKIANRGKLL